MKEKRKQTHPTRKAQIRNDSPEHASKNLCQNRFGWTFRAIFLNSRIYPFPSFQSGWARTVSQFSPAHHPHNAWSRCVRAEQLRWEDYSQKMNIFSVVSVPVFDNE